MTTDERLDKVERELARAKRRNRWLLVALGLAVGAWILAGTLTPRTAGAQGGSRTLGDILDEAKAQGGTPAPTLLERVVGKEAGGGAWVNEVRAKRFVLVDDAGRERAMLDVLADGPRLALFDAAGKPRAWLSVDKDGPVLGLGDENGKGRVVLAVDEDGPWLHLRDAAGKARVALSVLADLPVLHLLDAAGEIRVWLSVRKGGPGLHLFDENRKERATLTVRKNGPGLVLFDAAEKVIWTAP